MERLASGAPRTEALEMPEVAPRHEQNSGLKDPPNRNNTTQIDHGGGGIEDTRLPVSHQPPDCRHLPLEPQKSQEACFLTDDDDTTRADDGNGQDEDEEILNLQQESDPTQNPTTLSGSAFDAPSFDSIIPDRRRRDADGEIKGRNAGKRANPADSGGNTITSKGTTHIHAGQKRKHAEVNGSGEGSNEPSGPQSASEEELANPSKEFKSPMQTELDMHIQTAAQAFEQPQQEDNGVKNGINATILAHQSDAKIDGKKLHSREASEVLPTKHRQASNLKNSAENLVSMQRFYSEAQHKFLSQAQQLMGLATVASTHVAEAGAEISAISKACAAAFAIIAGSNASSARFTIASQPNLAYPRSTRGMPNLPPQLLARPLSLPLAGEPLALLPTVVGSMPDGKFLGTFNFQWAGVEEKC